ncbi:MAG: aminoacyl-tRNA hydrolase [Bacteroidia bacterium]|nr:aminoacyl-tRNA hydrolase [Bacteroidia bacterium]
MNYLIVGLGNPGEQYIHTRHNIGFDIIDNIASNYNLSFKTVQFAQKCEWDFHGNKIILLKPDTFMNLSGRAVQYWLNWYKIPLDKLLILVDDLALPIGKIRIRKNGSAGGHNGLKDIERALATKDYNRLRFGVGNNFKKGSQVNFVLGKFTEPEKAITKTSIEKSSKAVEHFILHGIDKTMEQYNH